MGALHISSAAPKQSGACSAASGPREGRFLERPSRKQLRRLQLVLEHGEQRWCQGSARLPHQPRICCGRRQLQCCQASPSVPEAQVDSLALESDILTALRRIIDPDLGKDVVDCGFVRDLRIDHESGGVDFTLRLTTPACPIKEDFRQKAEEYVGEIEWVRRVGVKMDADPPQPLTPDDGRSQGLSKVAHIIAVSSCKGGVGKSTTAVNLAYTLAQMGAKVGIFDADVYGPSLPTMVSPELRVLKMNPETRTIEPLVYEGVKAVSFGFAGQGSAIMRGPMVSGVVQQLLTTTEWDRGLLSCRDRNDPQKLAFLDVAKGIRMFARLAVPCVAVVENMAYFDGDGKRYYPFGKGSGERIVRDFGLPTSAASRSKQICQLPGMEAGP
ncbi:hypothetical protein WJX84_007765 [Apatococcus fuscideae]|uniref:MIP18 family-like domain-containing protein n=1 Tax=Apatococcus fuscideae TaxID=2026836 RepID=A0AAW1SZI6_9CHLO